MSLVAHDAQGTPWALVWVNPSATGMNDDVRIELRMTARELITMGESGYLPQRVRESLEKYVGTLKRTMKMVDESKAHGTGPRTRQTIAERAKALADEEPA